jgi:DNA-binding CsgD family transcriptional regulator
MSLNEDTRRQAMLLEVACAASEATAVADLEREALPLLARTFGAAESMLYGLSDDGQPTAYGGTLRHFFHTYAREYLPRDPQQEALICHNPPIARVSRFLDVDAFRRTDIYDKAYRGMDIEHVVQCRLGGESYVTPGMSSLALFRRRDQPDWGPHEERALASVLPVFRAVAQRSAHLDPLRRAPRIVEAMIDAADPRPRCALDLRAKILWISSRAERLLSSEGGASRVPDPLASAALELGARVANPPTEPVEVCLRTRDGSPLRMQLRLARSADGSPFIDIAIEEFAVPSPALADLSASAGLTPAETRVLGLLSLGLPNSEIARRLFLSVETVRTHVSRILRKLGAPTRCEVVLRVRGLAARPGTGI